MLMNSGEHRHRRRRAMLNWALDLTPGMCLGAVITFGFIAWRGVLAGQMGFAVFAALLAAFSGAAAQSCNEWLQRRSGE